MCVTAQNETVARGGVAFYKLRHMRKQYAVLRIGRFYSFHRAVFERRAVEPDEGYSAYIRGAIIKHERARLNELFTEKAVAFISHFMIARDIKHGSYLFEGRNESERRFSSFEFIIVNDIARNYYDVGIFGNYLFDEPRIAAPERFAVQIGKLDYFEPAPRAYIRAVTTHGYKSVIQQNKGDNERYTPEYTQSNP